MASKCHEIPFSRPNPAEDAHQLAGRAEPGRRGAETLLEDLHRGVPTSVRLWPTKKGSYGAFRGRYGPRPAGFGWFWAFPRGVEWRRGTRDPRQTYCPIVRLSTHPRSLIWTNASGKPKVLGLDSDCRGMDEIVSRAPENAAVSWRFQVFSMVLDGFGSVFPCGLDVGLTFGQVRSTTSRAGPLRPTCPWSSR